MGKRRRKGKRKEEEEGPSCVQRLVIRIFRQEGQRRRLLPCIMETPNEALQEEDIRGGPRRGERQRATNGTFCTANQVS